MIKLDIPYRSQWDADADDHSADCGPTCVAMMLNGLNVNFTPDELYKFIGPKGKKEYTNFTDLRNAALGGGLTLTRKQYHVGSALTELRQNIDMGKAFIALVKYEPWRQMTGNSFGAGHFILVTGYDEEHVYIHDPLFGLWVERSAGKYYQWTNQQFLDGWGGFPVTENPNFACLISDKPFFFLSEEAIAEVNTAVMPYIGEELRRRIISLAAYEGAKSPNLNDLNTAVYWVEHVGNWANEMESYIVQSGNTYSGISQKYYGDSLRWQAIQKYNNLTNTTLFVGQRLAIPLPGPEDNGAAAGPSTPALEDPEVTISVPTVETEVAMSTG